MKYSGKEKQINFEVVNSVSVYEIKKIMQQMREILDKHLQPPVDTFPARFGRRQPKKMIGFEAETANPFPKQK